jgi:hypothetical protein
VRRFVRILLVGCFAVVAFASALYGSLWLWIWYKSAQVDAYYRQYPLLNGMLAREPQSTNDSEGARQVRPDNKLRDTLANMIGFAKGSSDPARSSEVGLSLSTLICQGDANEFNPQGSSGSTKPD